MSQTHTNLPEPTFSWVLSCQVAVDIDAPIDKVWGVLTDFPKYPEWNPFVRSQTITDEKKNKLEDQTPKKGTYILMRTNIPPTMNDAARVTKNTPFELITHVDDVKHRVAWLFQGAPYWFIRAERWQALSTTEDGKTRYESREVFGGIGSYLIKWFISPNLMKGFWAMAESLKVRSEQL